MSSLKNIKLNNTTYSIDCDVKTINNSSLKGTGDLQIELPPRQSLLIWSGNVIASESYTETSTVNLDSSITSTLKNYTMAFFLFCAAGDGSVANPDYLLVPVPILKDQTMINNGRINTSTSSISHSGEAWVTVTDTSATIQTRACWNYPMLRKIYVI